MSWWDELRRAAAVFIEQHGLAAAFLFLLVEEAGVPVPVPGDVLMLVLGVQAREGRVALWQAIAVVELGTVLGATFLFFLSRWAGRDLVYRYGRYIRLTPPRLERAERWIRRYGAVAVVVGRLLPGLRIVTAVACGVFGLPARIFLPAMALGALLYITAYTLLGYYFGPPVLDFVAGLDFSLGVLLSLALLVVLLVWIVRARVVLRAGVLGDAPTAHGGRAPSRARRLSAGAMAGALATLVSTLFMNVLTHFTGALAFQAPGTMVERTAQRLPLAVAREGGPWLLALGYRRSRSSAWPGGRSTPAGSSPGCACPTGSAACCSPRCPWPRRCSWSCRRWACATRRPTRSSSAPRERSCATPCTGSCSG